ncbi:hypothetical protein EJB05_48279 [Eragrostis curvula]|uniref:Complex III subunit VII n=1 Tax=Eragrostis curvula TaxID=38414 RepID=A0A5J9T2K1_9POAL|nr:hypothetical protein EJB05_48279 [Eragrostis curvula]
MSSMLSAFSQWFVNPRRNPLARLHMHTISSRLRKYGLRYDDLCDPYFDLHIKEALGRLPTEVVDPRIQRLKRAMDLSMKHQYLPENLQLRVSARWFSSAGLPPHLVVGMPALSPTMNQGNIAKWIKQEGDKIEILAPEGSKDVQVGQPIAVTVEDLEDIKSIPADTSFGGEQKEEQSTESAPQNNVANVSEQSSVVSRISPAAKILIKEHGLDASSLKASGPRGTLLKGDVLAALKSGASSSSSKEKKAPATPSSRPAHDSQAQPATTEKTDSYEDIPNSQIRKVSIKCFYLTICSINVVLDPLLAFRNELKEQHGIKVSVNDIIIKAVAIALRNVPEANAYWNTKKEETQKCDSVDISIAVATEKGLMTPIIRNADQKTISAISSESGILAVGRGNKVVEPVVDSDGIEKAAAVTKMSLTLSADHRVFDGQVGGKFFTELTSNFSDIRRLLL